MKITGIDRLQRLWFGRGGYHRQARERFSVIACHTLSGVRGKSRIATPIASCTADPIAGEIARIPPLPQSLSLHRVLVRPHFRQAGSASQGAYLAGWEYDNPARPNSEFDHARP